MLDPLHQAASRLPAHDQLCGNSGMDRMHNIRWRAVDSGVKVSIEVRWFRPFPGSTFAEQGAAQ